MPILNNITPEELAQFTGTTAYYSNFHTRPRTETSYGGVHTDGAHHLYMNGMAWFIDDISLFHRDIGDRFQVWKITPDQVGSGATIQVEDGNHNVLKKYSIEYAEIPCLNKETHLEIWCIDGVILLPTEY